MRVCFITNEFFGLGRYGGFGKLTRMMAGRLTERGVEVFVTYWRCPGQRETTKIDRIIILGLPYKPSNSIRYLPSHLRSYLRSLSLYRTVNADIYHSIELQVGTYVAQEAMPSRKHIVWFQDPYDENAYREMGLVDKEYTWNRSRKIRFYSTLPILRKACKRADGLFTQARCFMPIIDRLYKPEKEVLFLPNPVEISNTNPRKADEPTVCFLGRWDPQKRVEKFFHLARRFPEVRFIAMGKAHDENKDAQLRREYRKVRNLEMPGLVSETEKESILSKSWLLVNTSIREGLPLTFLEALAHKTAILSYVNPDGFASRFGHHVEGDTLDCFEYGLKKLLMNDLWKDKGEKGFWYVKQVHDVEKVIDEYLGICKGLLSD